MPDRSAEVRAIVVEAGGELVRVRAELEAVSRLFRAAHRLAGSDAAAYRQGDVFAALVLAGDAVEDALSMVRRFLELQVVALRDPVATLREVDFERGVERV